MSKALSPSPLGPSRGALVRSNMQCVAPASRISFAPSFSAMLTSSVASCHELMATLPVISTRYLQTDDNLGVDTQSTEGLRALGPPTDQSDVAGCSDRESCRNKVTLKEYGMRFYSISSRNSVLEIALMIFTNCLENILKRFLIIFIPLNSKKYKHGSVHTF